MPRPSQAVPPVTPGNGTLATAQDLDGSFLQLTAGTSQRGAVIGRAGRGLFGVDRSSNFLREETQHAITDIAQVHRATGE